MPASGRTKPRREPRFVVVVASHGVKKGTGRARQGSTRAPNWVGGGVVWGPHLRSYEQDCQRRCAVWPCDQRCPPSSETSELIVMEGLAALNRRPGDDGRCRQACQNPDRILMVMPEKLESIVRSSGNLENVALAMANYLNVRDVLKFERLVVMSSSIELIEKIWALPADRRSRCWRQARRPCARAEGGQPWLTSLGGCHATSGDY